MEPDLPLTDDERAECARRAEAIAAMSDALMATDAAMGRSALPYDPDRPSDAEHLLAGGMSPMEYASAVMIGRIPYDRGRMEACKAIMAYYHAPRTGKQRIEVSGDADTLRLVEVLRLGRATEADIARLRAEDAAAERAASQRH